MDHFSQVFMFTETAPGILGKYTGDMIVFAIFCVAGVMMLLVSNKIGSLAVKSLLSRLSFAVILIGGTFFVILSLVYFNALDNYRALQIAYDKGMYQVAEGVVSVISVQPPGCNITGDLIEVDDVEFEVNYCHGAPFGYNRTIKNNGVLTDGANARVYYTEGKTILRVDIKK